MTRRRKFPRPDWLDPMVIWQDDRPALIARPGPVISIDSDGTKYWRIEVSFKNCLAVPLRTWSICVRIAESFTFDERDLATRATTWQKPGRYLSRRYQWADAAIRVANALSALPIELFQGPDEDAELIREVLHGQYGEDELCEARETSSESDKDKLERIYHRRF